MKKCSQIILFKIYYSCCFSDNGIILIRHQRAAPGCQGPFGCGQQFYQPQQFYHPGVLCGAGPGYFPPPPPPHSGFGPPFPQGFGPWHGAPFLSAESAGASAKSNADANAGAHSNGESAKADASAVAKADSSGAQASATAKATANASSVNKKICIFCKINDGR